MKERKERDTKGERPKIKVASCYFDFATAQAFRPWHQHVAIEPIRNPGGRVVARDEGEEGTRHW